MLRDTLRYAGATGEHVVSEAPIVLSMFRWRRCCAKHADINTSATSRPPTNSGTAREVYRCVHTAFRATTMLFTIYVVLRQHMLIGKTVSRCCYQRRRATPQSYAVAHDYYALMAQVVKRESVTRAYVATRRRYVAATTSVCAFCAGVNRTSCALLATLPRRRTPCCASRMFSNGVERRLRERVCREAR